MSPGEWKTLYSRHVIFDEETFPWENSQPSKMPEKCSITSFEDFLQADVSCPRLSLNEELQTNTPSCQVDGVEAVDQEAGPRLPDVLT